MLSIPFVYFSLRKEEEKDLELTGFKRLIKEHGKAMMYLMFLFLGFVVAFSFWYIAVSGGSDSFRAQIETYCSINRPNDFQGCVNQFYGEGVFKSTGFANSNKSGCQYIYK